MANLTLAQIEPTSPRLYETAADLREAQTDQLYNQWHGYYVLCVLHNGKWQNVRPLSMEEARVIRLKTNEALELIWQT